MESRALRRASKLVSVTTVVCTCVCPCMCVACHGALILWGAGGRIWKPHIPLSRRNHHTANECVEQGIAA